MFKHFDVQKAIQAAGVLLRFERNRMSYIRLLKLLYIADRDAIRECGLPILGSRAVAMEHGPLHSDVYNLIKGIHANTSLWSRFFTTIGYKVEAIDQPENGLLSEYEIKKLQEVSEKYAPFTDLEICDQMTHTFGEWQKTFQENTSQTIQIEDIVEAVGRSGDRESILDDISELEEFDKLVNEV
jgi:uncharacterized phage-associated protein